MRDIGPKGWRDGAAQPCSKVHFAVIMWSVQMRWDAISGEPRAGTGRGVVVDVVVRREASRSAGEGGTPLFEDAVVVAALGLGVGVPLRACSMPWAVRWETVSFSIGGVIAIGAMFF